MRKELCDILSKNRPQLVENIDPENGMINDLIAMSVLTRRQAKSIEVLPDPFKQVESLLDMLRRRPDEDFDKFCDILCKHGQDELVTLYLNPRNSRSSKETESRDLEKENPSGSSQRSSETQSTSSAGINVQNTTIEFYNKNKDMAYPMCNVHRGKCFIFNVEIVRDMPRREGSEEDLRNLRELFTKLHFSTETFTNPTAKDMVEKVVEIACDSGLEEDQCLILFFLSHGQISTSMTRHGVTAVEHIYGSDGQSIPTETILEPLTNTRCPAMSGKPKLVFFQACRKYFSTSSTDFQETSTTSTDACRGELPESPSSSVPASAPCFSASISTTERTPISLKDFVIGYSTESGHPSFRDVHSGSWYVRAIVSVFCEAVHNMDLCAMLRKVNGTITEYRPVGLGVDLMRGQVASHMDSLTKPYLFFFPGIVTGNQ